MNWTTERQRSGVSGSVFGRGLSGRRAMDCMRARRSQRPGSTAGTARPTWARIAARIPAIHVRLSRFRGAVQQGPVHRQEAQIVQSCNTLDGFLPGFGPLSACRFARRQSRCPSDRVSLRPLSRHSIWNKPVFGSGNALTLFRPHSPALYERRLRFVRAIV